MVPCQHTHPQILKLRHIAFYNKDFMTAHPEIIVEKNSNSPDEDKCVHDAKLLIPTLKDFFAKHPLINPKAFLGVQIVGMSFETCSGIMPLFYNVQREIAMLVIPF